MELFKAETNDVVKVVPPLPLSVGDAAVVNHGAAPPGQNATVALVSHIVEAFALSVVGMT